MVNFNLKPTLNSMHKILSAPVLFVILGSGYGDNNWLRLSVAYGQSTTATLSGTVTDVSGAVVPDVSVIVTDPATGLRRDATTNTEGLYTIPLLPPGTYTLTAQREGFSPVEITGVVLNIGDQQALKIQLKVGQVGETVTVQADAGQLQIKSESGERSDLITNTQIKDLALNGRTTLELVKVLPGVSGNIVGQVSSSANQLNQFSINGTRFSQKELTIDGVSNVDTGNNGTVHVTVNPDAIAEVKVLTSNYQAEYGRAGGGFIAFVTKSGTNDFHGTPRYFRRHDSLNANPFSNNATGLPRPLYRYDYFGYDIGGPVYLPRFGEGGKPFFNGRDKLFFYFNQEYYQQLIPNVARNIRVPTAAERSGDFSNTTDGTGARIFIRDPNRQEVDAQRQVIPCSAANQINCFPGNIIPSNRFFRDGQAILNIYPLPNFAGNSQYNFVSQISNEYPRREDILRIDYNISERSRLTGRYINNADETRRPYGGTFRGNINFPLTYFIQAQPGYNVSFTLANTLNPTTTNEVIFGYSRNRITIDTEDDSGSRARNNISFPLLFPNADPGGYISDFVYGGIQNQTFPVTDLSLPFTNSNSTFNIYDNLTKVVGQHTLKTGVFFQRAVNGNVPVNPVSASINFANNVNNPLNTGHPYANALLGIYNEYQQADRYANYTFIYNLVEGYIQDTWRIRPRLTLDYGLRLSYYQPQYLADNLGSSFNPELFDPSKAVRLYQPICLTAAACPTGSNRRAVDPALLLTPAFRPTSANTLPANFVGLFVPGSGDTTNGIGRAVNGYPKGVIDSRGLQLGPRLGFAYDLTGDGNTVMRGGFGIAYDRLASNIVFGQGRNPPLISTPRLFNNQLDQLASSTAATAPTTAVGYSRDGHVPNIYSYSLGVQRNIGFKTVLDIAYVGTLGRHLSQNRNLNAIPYFTAFGRAAQDSSRYASGIVPEREPNLPEVYSRAGFNFSGANALPADFLRPYPGFGAITYFEFVGTSNYHSLQASVNRRFSQGLTFGVAYTFSKTLNTANRDGQATHPFETRANDYRLADFDRTHIFVFNYVYDLPKLSRFIGDNRLVRAIFDNFQVSGISQFSSGTPIELSFGIQGINAGQRILGTPDVQPGFYLRSDPQSAPPDGLSVDPNAFSVPTIGDIGPYSRTYLRAPAIFNHDISVFKNFPFGGEGRRYLQLRLELFNAFNQTQFTGINTTTQLTTARGVIGNLIFNDYNNLSITNNIRPSDSTDPRSQAPLGQFFGEYNSPRDPRIIQLGVKLYF